MDFLIQAIHQYQVDFIFLSHASLDWLGALPYLQRHGILDKVKIMSTSPTAKMGALTLYEYFIQRKEQGNFESFTL